MSKWGGLALGTCPARLLAHAAALGIGFGSLGSSAHAANDLILFPYLHAIHSDLPAAPPVTVGHEELKENEVTPGVTLFYSGSTTRLRFLAEGVLASDHVMLERMQVGLLAGQSTTVWLGQLHNPLGYWNDRYHHAPYLKTSISSPAIETFEDDGGIFPTHVLALLVEGALGGSQSPFGYSLGAGVGPSLHAEEMHDGMGMPTMTVQVLKSPLLIGPQHRGKALFTGKLIYRPDPDQDSEVGLFMGGAEIPIKEDMAMYALVRQTVTGGYVNWVWNNTHVIGALAYAEHRLSGDMGNTADSLINSYLQIEQRVAGAWTAFGRVEDTQYDTTDAYLANFSSFVTGRVMAGMRYDVTQRQALKLEWSHNKLQDRRELARVGVQWSMVFP